MKREQLQSYVDQVPIYISFKLQDMGGSHRSNHIIISIWNFATKL